MPANIFEIIINKGNEPVQSTEFLVADDIPNGGFSNFIGLIATQQTVPVYYQIEGLSNLSQMASTSIPTPYNSDFGQSSWSFEVEYRNGVYHANTFASTPAWTFQLYSVDNLGVAADGTTLLEGNNTPGFTNYFYGNGQKMNPEVLLYGIAGDGSQSPQSTDPNDAFWFTPTIHGDGELDFKYVKDAILSISTSGNAFGTADYQEAHFSRPAGTIAFGSVQTLNILDNSTQNIFIDYHGNLGSSNRSIRYQNKVFTHKSVELSFNFPHPEMNSFTWVDGFHNGVLWHASNSEGAIYPDWTDYNGSQLTTYEKNLVPPPIIRLANIFSKTAYSSNQAGLINKKYVTFSVEVCLRQNYTAVQELTDAYTDGVAADFTSNALGWTVLGNGQITPAGDKIFFPKESFFQGESYNSMNTSIYIADAGSGIGRLVIKNINNAIDTVAVARLRIDKLTSYRIWFQVGLFNDAAWLAIIRDPNGDVVARSAPYGTYHTSSGNIGFEFDTPNIANGAALTSNQYTLEIHNVGALNSLVGFDFIRFEQMRPTTVKAHPGNEMLFAEDGRLAAGGTNNNSAALALRDELDFVVTTSNFNKPCVGTDYSIQESSSLGVKGESVVEVYSEDFTNSSNFVIETHTAPEPFLSPVHVNSFSVTSETENKPSWATPQVSSNADTVEQVIFGSSTYCNPYALEADGTPLLTEEGTAKFNSYNNAARDAQGFLINDFVTLSGEILCESPHLNIFIDNRCSGGYVDADNLRIRKIKIEDNSNAYITRVGGADGQTGVQDKIRYYYDSTVTNVRPPCIKKPNVFPEEFVNGNVEVTFSWDFDSINAAAGTTSITPMVIKNGSTALVLVTNSNSSGSINFIPYDRNIEIEALSATNGVDAILNSISANVTPTGTYIMSEQYGSLSSLNYDLPHINAYNSALRIKSVDDLENLTTHTGQAVIITKALPDLTGATQVYLSVKVNHLATANTIDITENFTGTPLVTSRSSSTLAPSGFIQIQRNTGNSQSLPDFFVDNKITIEVNEATGAGDELDVIIDYIALAVTDVTTFPNNYITLDLSEDFEFPLNVINKNFEELSGGSGSYSKTLRIPATSKNKLAIFNQNELTSRSDREVFSGIKCEVKANGLTVFNGKMYYEGSELDEYDDTFLNLTIKGGNNSWSSILNDLNLRDLKSEIYQIAGGNFTSPTSNHYANSFYDNAYNEITFPLVDNGQWNIARESQPDACGVGWGNLKAAYRLLLVFERIFKNQGFTIKSDFLFQNTEWSDEFDSEFSGFTSNLIGIAPSMKTHEDDIAKSVLNIRMNNLQNGQFQWEFDAGNVVSYLGRPMMYSRLRMNNDYDRDAFFIDHCFLNFDEVHVDASNAHLNATMTQGLLGGVLDSSFNKLNANESSTKSFIKPRESGYYEINISVNGDFMLEVENHFLGQQEAFAYEEPDGLERLFSVALVENNVGSGIDTSWVDNKSLCALMYDIKDSHSIKLNKQDYDNTRFTLTIYQYLEGGVAYNVMAMDSIVCGDSMYFQNLQGGQNVSEFTRFGNRFRLNEVVLDMKLAESRWPMEGDFSLIYNASIASPSVAWRNILPDVTQLDFVSEISKIFNLVWATNEVTQEITVEPCSSFYDFDGTLFGYEDWSEKALIKNIEQHGVIKSNLIYSMADDSSDWAINNLTSEIDGVKFGDKKIITSIKEQKDEQVMSLDIFSALKMAYEPFICRDDNDSNPNVRPIFIPRIWNTPDSPLTPTIPEEKPVPNTNHNHKLAWITNNRKHANLGGEYFPVQSLILNPSDFVDDPLYIHYHLRRIFIPNNNYSSGVWGKRYWIQELRPTYLNAASYSFDENYAPNLTFSDILSLNVDESGVVEGGLFNTYHQSLINQFLLRDKKITAEVYLTPTDIANINFRKLINIDGNLYILSRIVDFDFSGETTEVELILATPTGTNTSIIL